MVTRVRLSIFLTVVFIIVGSSFSLHASCNSLWSKFFPSQNPPSSLNFLDKAQTERYHFRGEERYYQVQNVSTFKNFGVIDGLDQLRYMPFDRQEKSLVNQEGKLVIEQREREELPRIVITKNDLTLLSNRKKTFYLDYESAHSAVPSKNFYRAISYHNLIKSEDVIIQNNFLTRSPSHWLTKLSDPTLLEQDEWALIFRKYKEYPAGLSPNVENVYPLSPQPEYLQTLVKNGTSLMQELQLDKKYPDFKEYLRSLIKILMGDDYAGFHNGEGHRILSELGLYLSELPKKLSKKILSIPLFIKTLHLPKTYAITLPLGLGELVNRNIGGKVFEHSSLHIDDHGKALKALEKLFKKLKNDKLTDKEYLETLSDFYHIGANTHLFTRGNNSLFFGIVNYHLMKRGLSPVPHKEMDYIAMLYSYDEFRYLFMKHISSENPELGKVINPKMSDYLDFFGVDP